MSRRSDQGLVVWMTGLSGSGKSTIAGRTADLLRATGVDVVIVDGDDLRRLTRPHLGYSVADVRESNQIAIDFADAKRDDHDVVLVSRISPSADGRRNARERFTPGYLEVFVRASLPSVLARDPKGLYRRASAGSAPIIGTPGALPYEIPTAPDVLLDTEAASADDLAKVLVSAVERHR